MVAKRWVTKAVFAPIRAAALAASQPAWPPPITMTSKEFAWAIMRDFYLGVRKCGSENCGVGAGGFDLAPEGAARRASDPKWS
jgi:hypothetical protein